MLLYKQCYSCSTLFNRNLANCNVFLNSVSAVCLPPVRIRYSIASWSWYLWQWSFCFLSQKHPTLMFMSTQLNTCDFPTSSSGVYFINIAYFTSSHLRFARNDPTTIPLCWDWAEIFNVHLALVHFSSLESDQIPRWNVYGNVTHALALFLLNLFNLGSLSSIKDKILWYFALNTEQ